MTFICPFFWECHHPNWRSPSFFRGVAKNHQPVLIAYLLQGWRVEPSKNISELFKVRRSSWELPVCRPGENQFTMAINPELNYKQLSLAMTFLTLWKLNMSQDIWHYLTHKTHIFLDVANIFLYIADICPVKLDMFTHTYIHIYISCVYVYIYIIPYIFLFFLYVAHICPLKLLIP
jgi:hypothetical protein